ncbi:MAG: methyltransferase domain-containing protein [Blastocatellia bacterium]
MLTPPRVYIEELLDLGEGSDDDVARNLIDLRRINRFFGGQRVVTDALAALAAQGEWRELSLLDVGTGSADIPGAVADWCQGRGIVTNIAALDLSERNLRIARSRLGINKAVQLVRGDSRRLPFADRSFDVVTASLFLHHFEDADVRLLLAEFARVARRALIVNDLIRHRVPYWFARLTGPLLATSYLTRYDGPASVLRGFTVTEMATLAERAGLRQVSLRRRFPYRLSLIARIEEVATTDEHR